MSATKRRYDHVEKKWVDGPAKPVEIITQAKPEIPVELPPAPKKKEVVVASELPFKYCEEEITADLFEYLLSTYGEHYKDDDTKIECFDAWIALGDSGPTFRNTALKYLWRYGRKDGHNKKDLMKTLHYVIMLLCVDHYKPKKPS